MIKSPKLPNPLHRRCPGVLGTDGLGRLRRFLGRLLGSQKKGACFLLRHLVIMFLDVFMITKWLLSCFWLFLVPIMCFVLFSHLFGFQAICAATHKTHLQSRHLPQVAQSSLAKSRRCFPPQIWSFGFCCRSEKWWFPDYVGLESRFWIIQIFSWLFKSSFRRVRNGPISLETKKHSGSTSGTPPALHKHVTWLVGGATRCNRS